MKEKKVIIAKAGKLVVHKGKLEPRKFGLLKGKVFVPENFNDEDEEINEMFYGGDSLGKDEKEAKLVPQDEE